MTARKDARYLAPIALAATVIATFVLVASSLGTNQQTTASPSLRSTTAPATPTKPAPKSTDYVVQSGDNLSSIAQKTGASLAGIEALNPGVNPTGLQTGQHLKLPPK